MIPKIIHQIWWNWSNTPEPPDAFKDNAAKIRQIHPDYEHRLWNEATIRGEIERAGITAFFNKLPTPVHQADLFRYVLMYRKGGVYIDMDTECLKSFDELLTGVNFNNPIGSCPVLDGSSDVVLRFLCA